MNKVVLFLIGFCLFLSASSQTTAPAGTIRIGTFLSLTGSTAAYGISALNAIKLATDEVNRSGGINGKLIELVIEDDHSNTQEVAGIVNKLIKEDKVDALIADMLRIEKGGKFTLQQSSSNSVNPRRKQNKSRSRSK